MESQPSDDGPLIEAAKAGDEGALAKLFDDQRERLERMVDLRLDPRLQQRVDAADVVQETYLALRQKFSRFVSQQRLPFSVWIRLETIQTMIDVHRRHLGAQMRDVSLEVSLNRGNYHVVDSSVIARELVDSLTTASQVAMRDETRSQVHDLLNTMEPADREILVLRHFEDMSNVEAALLLNLSPTAASNRYVRALRKLKEVIEGDLEGTEGIRS